MQDKMCMVLILGLLSCVNIPSIIAYSSFNVLNFGAKGDGSSDDSQAFLKAWDGACAAKGGNPTVVIPKGKKFLVKPVVFKGPCNARATFQVDGEVIAPKAPISWKGLDQSQWLAFYGVTSGLTFRGSGTINGRGKSWWNQSCRDHPGLSGCTRLAPTAVKFLTCNNLSIRDVHFVNPAQTHILLMGCRSVNVNNLDIRAPGLSPNTDGIHIQDVHNLNITNSKIATGDDCISIGDYTSDVTISHSDCGPGHGISIGSLGRDGNEVKVENIRVSNVNFTGTTNGARIKTWQVGRGNVKGVRFENLSFHSVENPVIIDQNYCERRGACPEKQTGVHISDVTFKGMVGTSSTAAAITLNCSRAVPCTGILLESIQLASNVTGQAVTADCSNARGTASTTVKPNPTCLRN